ncbi:TetR/AcrR family transcriptional regulator [Bacillus massilinigeriensis]|uniref:TetR/AcrR family transcriptional regulator n=1 Tax=Bacillus mediterraneensis TaxID=1805474 RepID=UPI0008F8AC48|nr:TetR/AcrR family transcriptional regulator [Bacillus mediterraneensis]
MTAVQIKEVARKHFAENGFEGTSMAKIAEDVGIKKQSIYTHFKGKDELFLQVCLDVFTYELESVVKLLENSKERPIEEFLFHLLLQYKERYEQDESIKFWLRISFFPPTHLYESITDFSYQFLNKLEALLIPVMKNAKDEGEVSASIDAKKAIEAYLGLLDGVLVEMLYGNAERLHRRIDSSWYLYWRGLSKD